MNFQICSFKTIAEEWYYGSVLKQIFKVQRFGALHKALKSQVCLFLIGRKWFDLGGVC